MNKLNFARKKLSTISNMPQLSTSISGWGVGITFIKIETSIIDFEAVQTEMQIKFKGIIQPLKPQEIELKPEEQRSWNWIQVHCSANIKLKINDKLVYNSKKYKVMAFKDYSLSNFVEYHLIEEFETV